MYDNWLFFPIFSSPLKKENELAKPFFFSVRFDFQLFTFITISILDFIFLQQCHENVKRSANAFYIGEKS